MRPATAVVHVIVVLALALVLPPLVAVGEGLLVDLVRGRGRRAPVTRLREVIAGLNRSFSAGRARPLRGTGLLRETAPWLSGLACVAALAAVPLLPGGPALAGSVPFVLAAGVVAAGAPVLGRLADGRRWGVRAALRDLQSDGGYLLPMLLAACAPVVLTGSLSLDGLAIVWTWWWSLWLLPALVVFLAAGAALLHRAPFHQDPGLMTAPEPRLGLARLGEDAARALGLVVLAVVAAALFLGGWAGPGAVALGWLWLLIKAAIVLTLLIAARVLLPAMPRGAAPRLAWAVALPLAALWTVLTAGVVIL